MRSKICANIRATSFFFKIKKLQTSIIPIDSISFIYACNFEHIFYTFHTLFLARISISYKFELKLLTIHSFSYWPWLMSVHRKLHFKWKFYSVVIRRHEKNESIKIFQIFQKNKSPVTIELCSKWRSDQNWFNSQTLKLIKVSVSSKTISCPLQKLRKKQFKTVKCAQKASLIWGAKIII